MFGIYLYQILKSVISHVLVTGYYQQVVVWSHDVSLAHENPGHGPLDGAADLDLHLV